ncbi:MAG: Maf family nucleotide pyrophosphatase [Gammaproteobacteria bacterium]|jgi:MAF protein|nr:Maf family nucleotide pyrophosphatase [Gammaproteobacteria bacterium]|tara:strand:- start:2930 stop:3511 length:582 start_codon:yes stop_codon:yes gene_type:complete
MNEGIKKNNIILASSSIYRSRLLKKYIKNFSTRIPDVDETPRKKESAKDLSLRLALSKAKKISNSEPDSFIIGSDQVASFKGTILGKPMNYEDAFNTIKKFSKEDVIFFTGIALINKNENLQYHHIDITTISFKDFNDQMLKNYLDSEENLNTTAGVKMESRLFRKLIYKVQTEDEEAIIGLPIQWLLNTLDS